MEVPFVARFRSVGSEEHGNIGGIYSELSNSSFSVKSGTSSPSFPTLSFSPSSLSGLAQGLWI